MRDLSSIKVLIACEYSGIVRNAFASKGVYVVSCDLLPGESLLFQKNLGSHYQGSVFDIINNDWTIMIAFPPCTYLSYAANKYWNCPGRENLRNQALDFFVKLYSVDIPFICLENPVGYARTWRVYDQIINPFQFGDPFAKRTCLWLKSLPRLVPTNIVEPVKYYYSSGLRKSSIQVFGKGKGDVLRKTRSRFWPGIANAMADQWLSYIINN